VSRFAWIRSLRGNHDELMELPGLDYYLSDSRSLSEAAASAGLREARIGL